MSKESVRIQMYSSTKAYLENLAVKHNCIRGKKPKIDILLEQIEKGKLEIREAIYHRENLVDRFSIGLEIIVPKNLKGIIAIVSEKIVEFEGNISRVKTKINGTKGIIQIFLVLPAKSSLKDLISSLQHIKVKEIEQFYEDRELDLTIANRMNNEIDDESLSKKIEKIKYKRLITDITCAIGYELGIKNEVGVLAKVSRKITEARLLISSVDECVGNNPEEAIMKLFIHIHTMSNEEILNHFEKIDEIFKELEKMPEVIAVRRLGVNSFD